MEHNNENESFNYTYSAKEQAELKKIREKYIPKEPDKMEQLRKLDQSVTHKSTTAALIIGIVGTLVMGIGMCYTMVWAGIWFIPGIIIGMIGIALLAAFVCTNETVFGKRKYLYPLFPFNKRVFLKHFFRIQKDDFEEK